MVRGENNAPHLKGRKEKGSGWGLTINANKGEQTLGEEGIQKFKKAIQDLFREPHLLARIINFNRRMMNAERYPEMNMDPEEAIRKYVLTDAQGNYRPVAFEGVVERVGVKQNTGVHVHGILGIEHFSLIQLNAAAVHEYFKQVLGYNVHFKMGGDGFPASYNHFPTLDEIETMMKYAGKNMTHDGDYFTPEKSYTVAQFEALYRNDEDFDPSQIQD
jgi:hypothetical protein